MKENGSSIHSVILIGGGSHKEAKSILGEEEVFWKLSSLKGMSFNHTYTLLSKALLTCVFLLVNRLRRVLTFVYKTPHTCFMEGAHLMGGSYLF